MKMIPVEGYTGLYRDENTNAIVNCNSSEYDEYLKIKQKHLDSISKINSLERDINDIKNLLIQLIENK